MPIVKVGEQRIKFPDSMSQEEIGAVLQQQFQQPEQPAQASVQTRVSGRSRTVRPLAQPSDPFEGLPQETIAKIEQEIPLPTGDRVRGGQRIGVQSRREKAAELERIRQVNPDLASLIEETGDVDAFLIGAGRGLTNVARGVGLAEQEDDTQRQAVEGLKSQTAAATGGEIVGETAPFLAIGGPAAGLAKTTAQKAIAGGVLGAVEGGVLTAGRGGDAKQIATGAALGGLVGGAAPLAPAATRGIRNKLDRSVEQGRKLLKEPTSKEISQAISEAAPSSEQLRTASKEIYDSLSETGATFSDKSVNRLIRSARQSAKRVGYKETPAALKLTPKSKEIFDLLEESKAGVIDFDEIESIRKSAQNSASIASRAGNNQDASILNGIVDDIDDYLLSTSSKDFTGVPPGVNLGREAATARGLWGRARKAELLDEAITLARSQKSGFENGIRIQFERIAKNKKLQRFFKPEELEAIKAVEQGTVTANTLRRIGKMGWGEGKQNTVLNALVSGGVGGAGVAAVGGSGLGMGISVLLFPAAATISGKLARRLTQNKAAMANQLIRAGSDAKEIAKIYLRNTAKAERSADDLAAVLMRPDLNIDRLQKSLASNLDVAAKILAGLPDDQVELVNTAISKALKDRLTQSAALAAPLAAGQAAAESTEQ
jgi:hypothetical protein